MVDWLVAGRFEIKHKLGSGTYGEIYLGHDIESGRDVALKFERAPSPNPMLHIESHAYTLLAGGIGIPEVIWIGFERSYAILVIQYLGRSLEDLLSARRRPFSLKTVLMLVDQSLRGIEFLHRKGLLHRDIKPSNLLMNLEEDHLYFIDFGLSKSYLDPETGEHIAMERYRDLIGTPRFASPYVMRGMEPSRRDDLISLGYVWVYLFKGALPWQGLTRSEFSHMGTLKEETSPDDLCFGMPDEFAQYFSVVLRLQFTEEPPYALLRNRFCELFRGREYVYDASFDWMQRRLADRPCFPRRFSLQSIVVRAPADGRIAVPRPGQASLAAKAVIPSASPLIPPAPPPLDLPHEPEPRPEPEEARAVPSTGRPPKMPLDPAPRLSLEPGAKIPSVTRLVPPKKGLTLPSGRRLSLGSLIAVT
jgi:serine/threonine protein kinase